MFSREEATEIGNDKKPKRERKGGSLFKYGMHDPGGEFPHIFVQCVLVALS